MSSRAAALWGGAEYENVAQRFASIHDELVARLGPQPGERFLDVATGTGEVALRAARAGAEVTGLDIAPALLEQARAKAEADALEIEWIEGDAQALPFRDGSFDVVSSSFGVIFAPDAVRTARELGRVTRTGARLGLTTWRRHFLMTEIIKRFVDEPSPVDPEQWSEEEKIDALLGSEWDLEIEERVWRFDAESVEAAWDWSLRSIPPLRALHRMLDADAQAELREFHLAYWRDYVVDGRLDEPRHYLLTLGTRR